MISEETTSTEFVQKLHTRIKTLLESVHKDRYDCKKLNHIFLGH